MAYIRGVEPLWCGGGWPVTTGSNMKWNLLFLLTLTLQLQQTVVLEDAGNGNLCQRSCNPNYISLFALSDTSLAFSLQKY